MTAREVVEARLREHTGRDGRGGWPCPAHDDSTPSLSVASTNDRVIMFCHAGCATEDVVAALGLTMADLFDTPKSNGSDISATYDYVDEDGTLLFQVVRKPGKQFRQRRPDGAGGWVWKLGDTRRVLYRLPQVLEAVANGDTIYIVEGEKDADRLRAEGVVATCNPHGAGKWHQRYNDTLKGANVIVIADLDEPGRAHAEDVAHHLDGVAASVEIRMPYEGKDASDHFQLGHGLSEFLPIDHDDPVVPITLAEAHATFRRWLGADYDLDAINATLATAAAERLGGDPLWLLLVSGSGNAKTETVQALKGSGAHIISTISSEGALLSGSPNQQRAKNATGGLLRQVGDHGVLVIKDVTSILSMNRDSRASLLAAVREIHDGHWVRYLGVDGGKALEWTGRIGIIGAVTTAWDKAHDVIASMGDRFIILRMDSTEGRIAAGQQSRRNVDHEEQMRTELSDAVAGVLAGATAEVAAVNDEEGDRLLAAADIVTLSRTGVEYDYRGDVIDAHAPEMPTRFTKQLVQVMRGAVSIGMGRDAAMRLAIRCARDSMPPLRLSILDDIAANPRSLTHHVRKRLGKPRATVDRQLQALHMLGVLACDEEEEANGTRWYYRLADGIDPTALEVPKEVPEMSVHTHIPEEKQVNRQDDALRSCTDISGTSPNGEAKQADMTTDAAVELRGDVEGLLDAIPRSDLVCIRCGGPPDHPTTTHKPYPATREPF